MYFLDKQDDKFNRILEKVTNLADLLEAEVDENEDMITISKVQLDNVLKNRILMKMKPDYVITTRGGIIVGTTDNLVNYCQCGDTMSSPPNHSSTTSVHVASLIVSILSSSLD